MSEIGLISGLSHLYRIDFLFKTGLWNLYQISMGYIGFILNLCCYIWPAVQLTVHLCMFAWFHTRHSFIVIKNEINTSHIEITLNPLVYYNIIWHQRKLKSFIESFATLVCQNKNSFQWLLTNCLARLTISSLLLHHWSYCHLPPWFCNMAYS